jgi:hypothetical protein
MHAVLQTLSYASAEEVCEQQQEFCRYLLSRRQASSAQQLTTRTLLSVFLGLQREMLIEDKGIASDSRWFGGGL